jgi:tetratricopeptide (TPR) repeat protein
MNAMRLAFVAFICLAGPTFAGCPAPPDISDRLTALVAQAQDAENEIEGRKISGRMWQLWLRAPDAAAQEVLDRGMRARASFDFVGALAAFDRLIDYCPEYAEGFNQRAFVHFLREDYGQALLDLDKALILSPRHVGAQSGRALTLMNLDRPAEAREQLLEALENDPWLSERFLLNEGGPLAATGKDI